MRPKRDRLNLRGHDTTLQKEKMRNLQRVDLLFGPLSLCNHDCDAPLCYGIGARGVDVWVVNIDRDGAVIKAGEEVLFRYTAHGYFADHECFCSTCIS